MPITVDGRSFTKTMAWTVNRAGSDGGQGVPGPQVSLIATSQVLGVPAGGGATTPATSTVTGTSSGTTISVWQYSVDGAAFSATVPAGVARTGNVVTITGATMTARTIAVRMADAAGVDDTLTVARVADGATGTDAYTVILTNEAHTFPGSTTAAQAGSTTSSVIAYKGSVQQVATIGAITGQVTGLTTAVTNNGTANATVTVTVTTALTAQGGTLTVPITVDGQTFTKTIAWSVNRAGADGGQGTPGPQVSLIATSQVLGAPAGGGATTPATSTVTGTSSGTTISVWQYSVDGAAFSATVPAGVARTGNVVTITGSTMTARTIAVRMADAAGVDDTLTVAKVADGATGADAYTVLLTNEAHTFPGSTTAAQAGSTTSGVIAYRGTVQQAATIGTITGQVTGLTTTIQNNGTTAAQITVAVTTALTAQGGTLTVPITVGGQAFTKTIAWSVNRAGSDGGQGPAGAQVSLIATAQVLAVPPTGGGTTPATSTITGTSSNTTISVWQYAVDGAAFSATVPAGVSRTGNVVTITGATMTARTIAVRMADAAGVDDTLTVAKVADGAGGGPGQDAYTVLLTNEAHTFPGSTTAAQAGSTTSRVIAFKGTVQQSATIGTITGQVTGLTTAITDNATANATITITVTTALVTQGGTLNVPVTVDGQTFTKTIAWSVNRTGSDGPPGTGVDAITPYYALVSAAAAAPAKPTAATPPAPWTLTQPAYARATALYQSDKVTFSNGTFAYTEVTRSSVYQAVDEAVAASDEALLGLATATGIASGKVRYFFLPIAPVLGTNGQADGDLWFDTDDGNKVYRWRNGQWNLVKDQSIIDSIDFARLARDYVDGKIVSFYQDSPPTAPTRVGDGDFWVDTNDNDRMYRWNAATSAWVDVQDGAIQIADQVARDALNRADAASAGLANLIPTGPSRGVARSSGTCPRLASRPPPTGPAQSLVFGFSPTRVAPTRPLWPTGRRAARSRQSGRDVALDAVVQDHRRLRGSAVFA